MYYFIIQPYIYMYIYIYIFRHGGFLHACKGAVVLLYKACPTSGVPNY